MRGKTIVIDREYGSGGREVAKLLSEKLGIPFYDGELLDKITKPYEIYEAQAKVMRQLVSEGPCIFLGRCAAEILKDKTELLNVFIYSSDQHAKTERIIRVDGVAQSNAVTELHKRDVQRGNYYHYFSKKTWGDRNHYDLCLNTAELGYEKAAEILAAAAK